MEWMTQEGLAASTRATIVSTIRSVQPLNRALDAAVIKVPHRQVMEEVLSIPEIQKVLAYLKEKESWFYPVFALWLSTGLRNAELIGLTWDAVRLAEGELLITKSLRRDGVNTHLRRWGTTKTGRSRLVPLNPVTLDQRLVAMEARIQTSLLEVAPDLRRNRKSLGSRNRVIEPPEAVDEMVLPLKPHP